MISNRPYPLHPIVGVGAIVLVGGEASSPAGMTGVAEPGVVLVRRASEPLAGQWSLPGGRLELGETLEAGVAREVAEETGLTVRVGPLVDVLDRIVFDEDRKVRYHFVLVDYLCTPAGGRLRAGSDAADVVIAQRTALDRFDLTPQAGAVIRRALEMAQTPGGFITASGQG